MGEQDERSRPWLALAASREPISIRAELIGIGDLHRLRRLGVNWLFCEIIFMRPDHGTDLIFDDDRVLAVNAQE